MSKASSPSSASTQKADSARGVDVSKGGASTNGSSTNGSSGSSNGSSTSTNGSTSAKAPTGPRRFRGDVPAFNPSSSLSSPRMYPDMRYQPQLQPMYPQSPQFYSQQPLMFNGQMMQPYYPMMGYPEYMYQPYQYYMNPYQALGPVPYMNNMGNFPNRKKHSRNNYYQGHSPHPNINGKHNTSHHSSTSSYPSTSPNDNASGYTSSQAASPHIASATTASSYTEEKKSQEVDESQKTVPPNDNDKPNTTELPKSERELPLLFNITLEEFDQERNALVGPHNEKMQRKLLHQNMNSVSENLYIADVQRRVVDVNVGSESLKPLRAFLNTKTTSGPTAKAPMNWAALLLSSGKKSASKSAPVSKSESLKTPASAIDLANAGPMPLGAIAIMMLYDPKFDINSVNGFNLRPRGLTNSGNICYMNAVLQCLIFCPSFNKVFSFIGEKSIGSLGGKSSTPLIDAMVSFMTDFVNVPAAQNGGSVVNSNGIVVGRPLSPEKLYMKLIESPQFLHLTWGQQEDAEEFLGYLLDGLHEEFVSAEATVTPEKFEQLSLAYSAQLDSHYAADLRARMKTASRLVRTTNKTEDKEGSDTDEDKNEWSEVGSKSQVAKKRVSEVEPSPITRLFGGKFRSVLTIPKGKEGNSITVDPFRCILVDISQENVTTIEDALSQFNEGEKIPYKLDDGLEVTAKKQTFIDGLPEILILQLKRFSYRNDEQTDVDAKSHIHGGTIEKVMKNVKFGLDLTISPEILSPSIRASARNYLLIGAIYHHGRNAEGGHYTCDVLRSGQDWLRIDDNAVEAITSSKVIEKPEARDKSAYILMYQRKDPEAKRW